jgi:hypothetical protein
VGCVEIARDHVALRLLVAGGLLWILCTILSCRFTGTIVTVSMPKGSLNRRPGPTVPMNRPNRWITPTLSGPTV